MSIRLSPCSDVSAIVDRTRIDAACAGKLACHDIQAKRRDHMNSSVDEYDTSIRAGAGDGGVGTDRDARLRPDSAVEYLSSCERERLLIL